MFSLAQRKDVVDLECDPRNNTSSFTTKLSAEQNEVRARPSSIRMVPAAGPASHQ